MVDRVTVVQESPKSDEPNDDTDDIIFPSLNGEEGLEAVEDAIVAKQVGQQPAMMMIWGLQ